MIPPRGCAYIVMIHRQDAFRALQKLSRGSYKVNQKAIKVCELHRLLQLKDTVIFFHVRFHLLIGIFFCQIAWALNKGIKPEFKSFWDVELGVTYIPWSKITEEQLEELKEGGMLDVETFSPGKNMTHFLM